MPTTTPSLARLVLVLDKLLSLADTHERDELARYRQLAFSFLTYDTAVSRLMASLGIQCEMRLETLEWVTKEFGLPPRASRPSSHTHQANRQRTARLVNQHFFINDPRMACDELNHAIDKAAFSLHFYDNLMEASAMPALTPVLSAIIKQKRTEHAVLVDYLDNFAERQREASSA
ncbi:hypothetical protein [Halomonas urumqiensis]|uniref:DUF2383 domain-containing protein n=1 Tax=Halomonas urumqiensis TaxID=1684789 RepID=A0A2N7UP22_9GAMM|nr:hypothetical protein [Halomonas urumqiensis]PMR82178.1 hypothetical protein C1H70_03005 [Halomonas urumqiensis]PTB03046.1 hypothetical protein C6V82_00510 [Halomonas urumqiensis]GHE20824.1 hypothetical protein GCM10017767_13450 [Halomonas urumqiensis]